MSAFPLQRPLLPRHYRVLLEPPDAKGDETIVFVSESRRVKLRGHSFREFQRAALPLLDGRHSVAEIAAATADLFTRADLEQALDLLLQQGLLREGEGDDDESGWRAPQLNLWHDMGLDPAAVQARLAAARVAVFGLAGAAAHAAQALAAAGVGTLRLVESEGVQPSDTYLAPVYAGVEPGTPRAEVLHKQLAAMGRVSIETVVQPLADDAAVRAAVQGANFVLCGLDGGRIGIIYKLNRVCLALGLPWLTIATAGAEALVGPLMRPPRTACYMCYRMRLVAAAQSPEDEYALQSLLDRRRRDDSPAHESLAGAEGVAGQLGALEVVKLLGGVASPPLEGQLLVFDLVTLASVRHRVLKKPWCPACQGGAPAAAQTTATQAS